MIDIVNCVVDEKIKAYSKELGFSKVLGKKNILVKEGDSEQNNRKIVSDKGNDVLMNPELKSIKDKIHYRNSGINQVLAKLAKKNDIAIGFGFSFLLNNKGIARAKMLGRMKQNVRICRKYKVKMVVCSYAKNVKEMRGAKDLLAFARVLGMDGGEAKKALNWSKKAKKVVLLE
jgi:ribonuclease P/MRP protein subunit RPP1